MHSIGQEHIELPGIHAPDTTCKYIKWPRVGLACDNITIE